MYLYYLCTCTEYYLGVLIGEADKPETQVLLMNDPILKHDMLVLQYTKKNLLKKSPNILWAGEIEKIDGKYTRINETSQSYFEATPDGLKHIENFMNRSVDYKIEYIKYEKENEHLSIILKVLKDLRHDIRDKIGSAYSLLDIDNPFVFVDLVEGVKENLVRAITEIDNINKLVPDNNYDGLKELHELAIEILGILVVANQTSLKHFQESKMEYFMYILNIFSTQPSLKNTTLVIEIEIPTEKRTQIPAEQDQVLTLSEKKEKIASLDLINPNYCKSNKELLNFAREINSNYSAENVPDLISELFKKINQYGMDQKDMMIMFRSGLYEYMKDKPDINDNLELLMFFISSAYKAEKDGYIKIHLDYDQEMRTFFANNYGLYSYVYNNNSKLSDNQRLMITNTAKMMSIKIADPKLPTIRK